jgi:hypothetical protein
VRKAVRLQSKKLYITRYTTDATDKVIGSFYIDCELRNKNGILKLMLTDIEIAQSAKLKPISEIAEKNRT